MSGSIEAAPGRFSSSLAYAGIGSRKTPVNQLERMTRAAIRLARIGYTLRSGGADGADTAFERGAGSLKEIFLPWVGFNGHQIGALANPTRDAEEIASSVHPAWGRLSPAAKKLMACNTHQILGADCAHPCRFVLCWTPDGAESEADRGPGTGGTGQAIALADRRGIPVFNFARKDTGERLLRFLNDGCQ